MSRKLIGILLLIFVLLLAACGGSEDEMEPTAAPTAAAEAESVADSAEPTQEPVQESEPTEAPVEEAAAPEDAPTEAPAEEVAPVEIPVIRIGVNAEFEPFVYMDENGNLAGFDIDIMNALSAAANFEFTYVTSSFEGLFDGLENDDFEAAISGITITEPRKERVDFTAPYFEPGMAPVSYFSSGQGIAVLTDNMTIMGKDDLTSDVTVGVKRGTTGAEFANGETDANVVEFDEAQPALVALVDGDVTAIVLDTPVIIEFIKANPGAAIKLVGGPVTDEQYGIAVGKDHPAVLDGLNVALEEIQASGVYDQVFQKWFGSP